MFSFHLIHDKLQVRLLRGRCEFRFNTQALLKLKASRMKHILQAGDGLAVLGCHDTAEVIRGTVNSASPGSNEAQGSSKAIGSPDSERLPFPSFCPVCLDKIEIQGDRGAL